MNNDVYTALGQIVSKQDIIINELMSRHTTFRTGGPASLFIRPRTTEEIKGVLKLLKRSEVDFFILGNGSNLLVSDKGYDGVIISLANFDDIKIEDETKVIAQAGAMNSAIASLARDNSLTGFEFAAGIPGTIGGAMIMNAGAYGGEMKDITAKVTVLSSDGEVIKLDGQAMKFGYRTSAIKGKKFVVLSVLLELQKGNKDEIAGKMQELALKR
ncbi:MAG: UDP-N-acetylmuramate dehydrogenase, partial [Butyrivibrio sp.]|nr:UDP-N-acetylmuramate dehydrogenase [Butyrivibrio sp.]